MYKPPQNNNRVKSIKNKFEKNIENNISAPEKDGVKNGYRNNLSNTTKKTEELSESMLNGRQGLQRQTSDPLKRNIKRTPAFRVDRNVDRSSSASQRNCVNKSTLFENKVRQFSAVKSNCDNKNLLDSEKNEISATKCLNDMKKNVPKYSNNNNSSKPTPFLIKSKSSHDFQYIRSKFDKNNASDINSKNHNNVNEENEVIQSTCNISDTLNGIDLSLLYTEPIPKSLRLKNNNEANKTSNIKQSEVGLENFYSKSTLKLTEKEVNTNIRQDVQCILEQTIMDGLTDTLRIALKRPLPKGPAPKKPPRTFQHSKKSENTNDFEKNISFLHITKPTEKKIHSKPKSCAKKADPKYMLNKLENALRNNKLRARRHAKTDISTTSGEDSDDSLLFRSKSNRTLPKLPSHTGSIDDNSAFNFNCLNGLGCYNSTYEKIKEPNSSFFVGSMDEEHLYAEPYHYRKDSLDSAIRKRENSAKSKSTRNSLYYMSTPVLSEGEKIGNMNSIGGSQDDAKLADFKVNRQISTENSSLSSFTSDLDSTPSPMEESSKIKDLIESYESKSQRGVVNNNTCTHTDGASRVENLKNSLRQTLDRSFTFETAIKDSDSEKNDNENKVMDIIKKFQTYIKSVPKYCKPKINKDTLFYCCLIIEKVQEVAQIKFQYPSCAEVPHNIENLCFPESDSTPMDCKNTAQTYSLLITNDKGERMFGYCRRVLPEGSTQCLPLAYCILSKYRAPRFYKKILAELESRHGIKNKFRDELISQFYNHKFPKPGDSIKINLNSIEPKSNKTENKNNLEEALDLTSYVHVNKTGEYGSINNVVKKIEQIYVNDRDVKNFCMTPSYIVEDEEKTELVLTLHPDTRYEDSDLQRLHQLPADILLKIFSSMLLERKVILISTLISKLSSCIDSLQGILYPFTWHHTFIPILPEALWDIVESPTPVICGVLSTEVVKHHQIENGIVVNLDKNSVMAEEGDENKILSCSMQKVWKRSIAIANKVTASIDYVHSVYLCDAYLQVFIMCLKDYKKFFIDGIFQKEDFIKTRKTKGIRRFMKMFTETYMFLAFLDTVVQNPENLSEFDKKIEMYGSDESNIILDKLLDWNR